MFERRLHALWAGVALLAVGFAISLVLAADPSESILQGLDDRWREWMVEIRTPFLTDVAKLLSVVGGPLVTLPVRIAVVCALVWQRRWLQLGAFLGAIVCSELCIGPLKTVIDRPRPPGGLVETSSSSFPSGHAIAAAVTAFGLVVVLMPASPRRLRWIGVAAAFAGLMAISRTYLSVHWLSDVVAGVCFGTGLALLWPAGLELARARWWRSPDTEPVVRSPPAPP
jgi:membrane-associated phospholipid phosphatase